MSRALFAPMVPAVFRQGNTSAAAIIIIAISSVVVVVDVQKAGDDDNIRHAMAALTSNRSANRFVSQ